MKIQFFFFVLLSLTNCKKQEKLHKQTFIKNTSKPSHYKVEEIPQVEKIPSSITEESSKKDFLEEAKKAIWNVSLYLSFEEDFLSSDSLKNSEFYESSKKDNLIPLGQGTGFFISSQLMVTNFHVIQDLNENIKIFSKKDSKNLSNPLINKMKVVKISAFYDLALLKSSEKVKDYLKIKKSPIDLNLDSFFLLAYPQSKFLLIPVRYNTSQYGDKIFTFNRNINLNKLKGSSGAPIIDQNAKVIGVKYGTTDSQSFTSSFSALTDFLNGNNRDCSNLDIEECLNEEWLSLKEAYQKGNPLAEYRVSSLISYEKDINKRDKIKEIIDLRKKMSKVIKEVRQLNNLYKKEKSQELYIKYLDQIQIYNEQIEKHNVLVSDLNKLIS
ncbi:MAG: serine protease [Bdellovibrionales bacterium]|nr:serine protease [Bdellovibrionales bacterium]